jgi:acyl-coenzyme A thioesterase PaaI-like protein
MIARLSPATWVARSDRNVIRDGWDHLHGLPGGKAIFSRLLGLAAPYTGSIGAVVEDLGPGRAEVVLRDRKAVRNHLDSLHAIALANLAELTGSLAVAYGIADDARFIVAGISVTFVKKARGTVRAVAEARLPEGAAGAPSARTEIDVPVVVRDATGVEVTRAELRVLIGPKVSGR